VRNQNMLNKYTFSLKAFSHNTLTDIVALMVTHPIVHKFHAGVATPSENMAQGAARRQAVSDHCILQRNGSLPRLAREKRLHSGPQEL